MIAVWEMTRILPQEVTDERFGRILVSPCLQIEMLEFARDAADVEDTVGALHALQVDGNHVETVSKKEIAGGGIAVHQHLAIFPHAPLFTPAVA